MWMGVISLQLLNIYQGKRQCHCVFFLDETQSVNLCSLKASFPHQGNKLFCCTSLCSRLLYLSRFVGHTDGGCCKSHFALDSPAASVTIKTVNVRLTKSNLSMFFLVKLVYVRFLFCFSFFVRAMFFCLLCCRLHEDDCYSGS